MKFLYVCLFGNEIEKFGSFFFLSFFSLSLSLSFKTNKQTYMQCMFVRCQVVMRHHLYTSLVASKNIYEHFVRSNIRLRTNRNVANYKSGKRRQIYRFGEKKKKEKMKMRKKKEKKSKNKHKKERIKKEKQYRNK